MLSPELDRLLGHIADSCITQSDSLERRMQTTMQSRGEFAGIDNLRMAFQKLRSHPERGAAITEALANLAIPTFVVVLLLIIYGYLVDQDDSYPPSLYTPPFSPPSPTIFRQSSSADKENARNMQNLELTTDDINLMAKEVSRGDTTKRAIALTFDAGVDSNWKDIKTILDKYGVQATIFPTGQFIEKHKEDVADMIRSGTEIGDHSYSHPKFTDDGFRNTLLSEDQIRTEIRKFQKALDDATGLSNRHYPVRFFRFPYGNRNEDVREKVAKMGLQSIYWTIDSGGWMDGATSQTVKNRLSANFNGIDKGSWNGNIVVMHLGNHADKDALDWFLNEVIHKYGYSVGTVSNALARDQRPPTILKQTDMGYTGPFAFTVPD